MSNTNGSLIQKVCHCLDQGRSHIELEVLTLNLPN